MDYFSAISTKGSASVPFIQKYQQFTRDKMAECSASFISQKK